MLSLWLYTPRQLVNVPNPSAPRVDMQSTVACESAACQLRNDDRATLEPMRERGAETEIGDELASHFIGGFEYAGLDGAKRSVLETNRVDIYEASIYRLENGKIVEQWGFWDEINLKKQMGAKPK